MGSVTRAVDLDREIAVLAHALLGATASISGMARTLANRRDRLPVGAQIELVDAVERHNRWAGEVLGWLARGLPAEALGLAARPPR